jgi:hypothetical protein
MPRALFPVAGVLQAAPWLWYAAQAQDRGLPSWSAPLFAALASTLLATSLWAYLRPQLGAATLLVALCGASFVVVSFTSMFLGNAFLEILTACSLGLASLGTAWLRWSARGPRT